LTEAITIKEDVETSLLHVTAAAVVRELSNVFQNSFLS